MAAPESRRTGRSGREMGIEPIKSTRIYEEIVRQIKTMISEGRHQKKQVEASCLTRPVCKEHYLHRLRKTTATFWHEKNIPLRTIQVWLGHKSLTTTQKYLGVKDSAELQNQINEAKY